MTKSFYILSAIALINFILTVAVINTPNAFIKNSVENAPTPTPIIVTKKVVKRVEIAATEKPNTTNAQNPNITTTQPKPQTASTQPPVVTGCIVKIDGGRYDVTDFKKIHSGGDIFSCGCDMSSTFWGKHGQSELNKMQKYKI